MLGVCERAAGAVLLVLALPVMLGSALAVRLLSGRSPWIAHRRVGWRGADLWMLKLRTMWGAGAPPAKGRVHRRRCGGGT
ncbi:MAG: sugar transferase [Acidobacteriota bacterium]|nr:sugar transferase [Acidobacteriota bacterium]